MVPISYLGGIMKFLKLQISSLLVRYGNRGFDCINYRQCLLLLPLINQRYWLSSICSLHLYHMAIRGPFVRPDPSYLQGYNQRDRQISILHLEQEIKTDHQLRIFTRPDIPKQRMFVCRGSLLEMVDLLTISYHLIVDLWPTYIQKKCVRGSCK